MKRICLVGAGLSGVVIARELAATGLPCLVVDQRPHVAGNCHTERDVETGVMVHRYGPHIFHTDNDQIWEYVNRFSDFMPFVNRVKTTVGGRVYALPINLHTMNQFFGKAMSPDEARAFIASVARRDITEPSNFEEQALKHVGERLYKVFFYGYTKKQWGREPSELPASIIQRLPLRFNYDDNYFSHPHQGIPRHGYTDMVIKMLRHELIETRLSCRFEDLDESFAHVFYSGPIDRYYRYQHGELGYRTLVFERRVFVGDRLGTAVMNFGDEEVPQTRITEHRHFSPWEPAPASGKTVCFYEFSRACGRDDAPYYPIRLVEEEATLRRYIERAREETGITFMGRLGTYSYIDMDVTIARALETARNVIPRLHTGNRVPAFLHEPL